MCLCSYRGYYYDNCYMFEDKEDPSIISYKCYPLAGKKEIMEKLISIGDGATEE